MSEPARRETTGVPVPLADVTTVAVGSERIRTRLIWLLIFRATIITVLLVTSVVVRVSSDEPLFADAAVVLYALAAFSYASILGGGLWLRWLGTRGIRIIAYAQLLIDVVVATVVVVLTGGVESAFVFVYSLTVLNGAAVLQRRGAFALALASSLAYAAVFAVQALHIVLPLGADAHVPIQRVVTPFLTNSASLFLVAGLSGYLTDQLKKTSESLDVARKHIARLEELYAAVLESLPSGVLTVDAAGTIVYVNQAGADILGGTPQGLVGAPLKSRGPALAAAEATAATKRFESTVAIPGRGERFIGGSVASLTGLVGVEGRVVIYQDLTELRSLQNDVARAERLAELGRFAAGLAHEIRNPLAAMLGCLQLLRGDADPRRPLGEDGQRMVGIVTREAVRLSDLVTAFLTYARPAPPRLVDVPLAAVVQETVSAAFLGAGAGVAVAVEVAAEPTVLCDPSQLRQVLWNLLTNAVQSLQGPDGVSNGRVLVTVGIQDKNGVVAVDDSGPGVPEEIRQRIFEPFFTTRPEGTGLGLATSHQVLVQQGGAIAVDSSPLGGARFVVRVPLSLAQNVSSTPTPSRPTLVPAAPAVAPGPDAPA